jgi:NADP-dependent 3-hydroxy acid dehydrogenase YdfG
MQNNECDLGAVLVTGVSSGIGKALAMHLLENGYRVFGSVRKSADVQDLNQKWPDRFVPVVFDVTDVDSIETAVAKVQKHLQNKHLTAIVNNAGVSHAGPLLIQPMEEILQSFNVNVFGMLSVIRAFVPLMQGKENKHIINLSSVSGGLTVPFLGAYSATKHAVEALTQGLRRELKMFGIQVTAIEPGMIKTELFDKASVSGTLEKYEKTAYAKLWRLFNHSLRKQEAKAKSPLIVSQTVLKIIQSSKTKSRYPLDPSWFIGKLLPDKLFDKIICKELGITSLLTLPKR